MKTFSGQVALAGAVVSPAQIRKATERARSVRWVRIDANLLTLKNP